jgi:hypothetical protein
MTDDKPTVLNRDGTVAFWIVTLTATVLIVIALILGLVFAARL